MWHSLISQILKSSLLTLHELRWGERNYDQSFSSVQQAATSLEALVRRKAQSRTSHRSRLYHQPKNSTCIFISSSFLSILLQTPQISDRTHTRHSFLLYCIYVSSHQAQIGLLVSFRNLPWIGEIFSKCMCCLKVNPGIKNSQRVLATLQYSYDMKMPSYGWRSPSTQICLLLTLSRQPSIHYQPFLQIFCSPSSRRTHCTRWSSTHRLTEDHYSGKREDTTHWLSIYASISQRWSHLRGLWYCSGITRRQPRPLFSLSSLSKLLWSALPIPSIALSYSSKISAYTTLVSLTTAKDHRRQCRWGLPTRWSLLTQGVTAHHNPLEISRALTRSLPQISLSHEILCQ